MTPHVIVWHILQEIETDNKFSGEEGMYNFLFKSCHSVLGMEGWLRVQIVKSII